MLRLRQRPTAKRAKSLSRDVRLPDECRRQRSNAGLLDRGGYARTDDPAAADLILINTCAVREKAEERVFARASMLAHGKARPDVVLGITGCMAEHLKDEIRRRAPHVDLVIGPDGYRRLLDHVDEARGGAAVTDTRLDREETYEGLDAIAADGVVGHVTIQRGCDKFCTFCVVPYTRGRERGAAPREILRQVRALVESGVKEVQLLGQTVNSYRYEDVGFAALLRAVARSTASSACASRRPTRSTSRTTSWRRSRRRRRSANTCTCPCRADRTRCWSACGAATTSRRSARCSPSCARCPGSPSPPIC
jgi:tRNA A37 methylthiotransferase MiaB